MWAFVVAMILFHAANAPGGVYLGLFLKRDLHAPDRLLAYAFAVNMVAVDRTELEELRPYVDLAHRLVLLHAQVSDRAVGGCWFRMSGSSPSPPRLTVPVTLS